MATQDEVPAQLKPEAVPQPEKSVTQSGSIFSRLLGFSLSSNKSPSNTNNSKRIGTFYGVYIPCEVKSGPDEEVIHVYENREEALKIVKKYKEARFKVFRCMQDAVEFALRGAEIHQQKHIEGPSLINGHLLSSPSLASPMSGEKPSQFKSLKPQDLVRLRKAIEAGLLSAVRDTVWDNPRYLVSSGDTPAILQEGCRYNAMHIAAKAKNAEMCNLILTTVGDPGFIQLLYGDDNMNSCRDRAAILVDLYLNTPDKSLNETPLHFAVKFGAVDVVEFLVSFPQCNTDSKNKYGMMPKDIICERDSNSSAGVAAQISKLLNDKYYVPVVHSEDESMAPLVGVPFSPCKPPTFNVDIMSPRMEIRAYAGPMNRDQAVSFRRKWKTPPRSSSGDRSPVSRSNFRLKEVCKGLEAVGRNLAQEMNVGWKEYWPFLDTFTDFKTPEGLTLLENYLKEKYTLAHSQVLSDSTPENDKTELSLSLSHISFEPLNSTPLRDSALSPISDLCYAFKTFNLASIPRQNYKHERKARRLSDNFKQEDGNQNNVISETVNQLLCIERTCQVFAKRIADALNYALSMEPERAAESFKSDVKYLQNTIFSYMNDIRFQNVDFSLIHSRLGQLVVYNLKQVDELDISMVLIDFLRKLMSNTTVKPDNYSSDEEDRYVYRQPTRRRTDTNCDIVKCVAGIIWEILTDELPIKGPLSNEEECLEIWSKLGKCGCDKNVGFCRSTRRNASFNRKSQRLSSSPKSEYLARKLIFENEIGDVGRTKTSSVPEIRLCPAGDGQYPVTDGIYTLNVDRCKVLEDDSHLISEDNSSSDNDANETYVTACEDNASEGDSDTDDNMVDASNNGAIDVFIYGDEPTKMDRLVYDAIEEASITESQFPYTYRWRNSINYMFTADEREKWLPAPQLNDSIDSPSYVGTLNLGKILSNSTPKRNNQPKYTSSPTVNRSLTPKKTSDQSPSGVPLQVSNWLRVTGPNTPRSALACKSFEHNVSFGF